MLKTNNFVKKHMEKYCKPKTIPNKKKVVRKYKYKGE